MSLKPVELQVLEISDAVSKLLSRIEKIAVGFKTIAVDEYSKPGRTTHDHVPPEQACACRLCLAQLREGATLLWRQHLHGLRRGFSNRVGHDCIL